MTVTSRNAVADLLEVVAIKDADAPRKFTRVWAGAELLATSDSLAGPTPAPAVIMTQYPSEAAYAEYWESATRPIGVSLVDTQQEAIRLDPNGWVNVFGDAMPLPAATFGVRLRCTGLRLDPDAVTDTDFRLVDGQVCRVAAGDRFEPDIELTGAFTDVVRWTAGVVEFRDINDRVEVQGSVYLLASLAGVFQMFKGLRCPLGLVASADALNNLVANHRQLRRC